MYKSHVYNVMYANFQIQLEGPINFVHFRVANVIHGRLGRCVMGCMLSWAGSCVRPSSEPGICVSTSV